MEGTVLVKYAVGESWKKRHCILSENGFTLTDDAEIEPETEVFFSGEFYVQDATNKKILGDQEAAFLVSDLQQFTYFSVSEKSEMKKWTQVFRKMVVKKQKDEQWWLDLNQMGLSEEEMEVVIDDILGIYMKQRGILDPFSSTEDPTKLEEEAAIANLAIETLKLEEENIVEEENKAKELMQKAKSEAEMREKNVKRLSVMPGTGAAKELEEEMKRLQELKEIELLAKQDLEIVQSKDQNLKVMIATASKKAESIEEERAKESARITLVPSKKKSLANEESISNVVRRATRVPTLLPSKKARKQTLIPRTTFVAKENVKTTSSPIKNRVAAWQQVSILAILVYGLLMCA